MKKLLPFIAIAFSSFVSSGQALTWQIPKGEQAPAFTTPMKSSSEANFRPAFETPVLRSPSQVPREIYTTDDGITIWGNILYARSWEMSAEVPGFKAYNYTPNSFTSSQLITDSYLFANGSGAFYGGKFHMISKGSKSFLYCEYNVNPWRQTYREESTTKFQKLVATDCDYDPITGLTYGCFWNPDIQNYEFASVDYESLTHTTIAPMEIFSAIAINSKGVVYGIKESDGGLYIIDKNSGEQTFIGSTGIQPYLLQSAAFDRKNDILYWAVRQVGSVAYLATVNTDTGAVKRLAYFPDSEQISCLFIPERPDQGTPACVKNSTAKTGATADDIELTFYMPTKTVDGDNITSGNLDYKILLGGKTLTTGSKIPGAKVTYSFKAQPGYNAISIIASNDKGDGPAADMRKWCGEETPQIVSNVRISIDNANNNTVKMSWKANDLGIHRDYIGASNHTFDIVRMPGENVVASKISATTFSEVLGTENAGIYYYEITPYANGIAGEPYTTQQITATGIHPVPYSETFDTKASFDNFKSIDSNKDGSKWYWNDKLCLAEYLNSKFKPADDWLLTPEIALKKDQLYDLSFDCRSYGDYFPETLSIGIGNGEDVTGYSLIMPETQIVNEDFERRSIIFKVPADGVYRLGFHCTSDAYAMYVLIDNLSITEGPAFGAPAKVENLNVTADETGLLSAQISFHTPSKKADGSTQISTISNIKVYRNDTDLIKTFTNAAADADLSFTDTEPINGLNTYTVIPSIDGQDGPIASAEAYIGQDIPYDPYPATIVNKGDKYTITWTAPPAYGQSSRRGPVIVDELKYNIYGPDNALLYENVEGYSMDIPDDNFITGPQNMQSFHVSAVSPAGEGPKASTNTVLVGKSYSLPFRESFKNAGTPESFWWVGGYNVFQISSEKSYDNDGGCIRWKANRWDKTSWFNSGKINIKPAINPELSFAYYALPQKQFKLKVYIQPSGADDILLDEIDFSTLDGEEGWRLKSFNLSDYKDNDFVLIKFYSENAEPYVAGEEIVVYVDRIYVIDTEGSNISASSISAPASIFTDQKAEISVNVENIGNKPADYTVNLYVDDILYDSKKSTSLEPQSKEDIKFDYTTDITANESVSVYAEVVYEADLYPDDNVTETATIDILRHCYPVVDDLAATENQGAVQVTWSAPKQSTDEIHESFEDYVHKDTSFGQWTTIDNDGGDIYTNQIIDIGYAAQPLAFTVFNSIAAGVSDDELEYYAAHDGETSLLAISSQPTTIKNGDRNDDWLISPEISCNEEHKVSFWAKSVKGDTYGYENFEVLYSKGYPNDLSSFVSLGQYETPQSWTEYTVNIPVGAKYFAIRYISEDKYYLMLDDFRFKIGQMKILGYSMFRDGEKIADLPAGTTQYSDSGIDLDTRYFYTVTVKYENGESDFSNTAIFDRAAGMAETLVTPDSKFDVYTVDGIRLRHNVDNLDDLPNGIYIVGNRKVAIIR